MRVLRLFTTLLSAVLLLVPAAVLAPAAAAEETMPSEVHIELEKQKLRFGDYFDIQGQVTTTLPDGQVYFVEYADVTLQRQLRGKPWRSIATTVAGGSDGVFTFYNVKAVQNAAYRVRFEGKSYTTESGEVTIAPSTSAAKGVRVMRDFALSSTKRSGKMIFKGRVLPNYKGKAVQIQVRKCSGCGWKGYRKVRTNQRSRFSLQVTVPRTGTWHYRAKTPKSPQFIASVSDRYLSVYYL